MSIIGIGETVYDIIFRSDQPQKAVPGGSAFNAMISLGRVFAHSSEPVRVAMITETGDDHIGQIITSFMRQNHVSTDLVSINIGTQSHISLAFLDEQSNAQYEFYKDHASAKIDASKVEGLRFEASDVVLFGSFFAINPVLLNYTRALFTAAHEAGATLYYDINFRKSHIKDIPDTIGNLEENMRLATVVRGSAEDFGYLYGTEDSHKIYKDYICPHCPIFICTDGPRASWLFAPNEANPGTTMSIRIPTTALPNVVSTIGAGDNFNAGFIYALTRCGIHADDLSTLTPPQWMHLVETGQQFSAHVCQRIENYVAEDFIPTLG